MYKLSPSDFAYLWEDCRYCFYQKVKLGNSYSGPFPAMFGKINNLVQNSIMGKNLQDVISGLPSGVISVQEGFLKSVPINGTNCFVSGRFDILSKLDDGSYALIDFKITTPDEEKILKKYATQLHAYKYALENPAEGKAPLKISKMGIVSINPDEMKIVDGKIHLTSTPAFHPVDEDMESFFSLIDQIAEVLNGEMPKESIECRLCIYRNNFSPKKTATTGEDIPF